MDENGKIRILFVDDEDNVLRALKRALRGMRDEWDMHFLSGGGPGLELLEEESFDMVISDMYMPEMSGADFLRAVKNRYPGTIRVILSGHSDYELILKTIVPAHNFLHKPCSKDGLVKMVNSIQQFKRLVSKKSVRDEITEIGILPSQPLFYPLFNQALESGDPKDVAGIIIYDVAMVANILKVLMNSFLGEAKKLPTLEGAATMLGRDTLKRLVNSPELFVAYHDILCPELPVHRLWRHSFRTARYAAAIAAKESGEKELVNRCFMAGLLHDIGKFVLLLKYNRQYRELISIQEENAETDMFKKEVTVFGASHGTIGAYLMSLWGLPMQIVQAIAFHGMPSAAGAAKFGPLAAVHVANMVDYCFQHDMPGDRESRMDKKYLGELGGPEKIKVWFDVCRKIHATDVAKRRKLIF